MHRERIESLREPAFVERGANVIFVGPSGVGKTPLAINLAVTDTQRGRRVYYGSWRI